MEVESTLLISDISEPVPLEPETTNTELSLLLLLVLLLLLLLSSPRLDSSLPLHSLTISASNVKVQMAKLVYCNA